MGVVSVELCLRSVPSASRIHACPKIPNVAAAFSHGVCPVYTCEILSFHMQSANLRDPLIVYFKLKYIYVPPAVNLLPFCFKLSFHSFIRLYKAYNLQWRMCVTSMETRFNWPTNAGTRFNWPTNSATPCTSPVLLAPRLLSSIPPLHLPTSVPPPSEKTLLKRSPLEKPMTPHRVVPAAPALAPWVICVKKDLRVL